MFKIIRKNSLRNASWYGQGRNISSRNGDSQGENMYVNTRASIYVLQKYNVEIGFVTYML
jgi:hypothetical protein